MRIYNKWYKEIWWGLVERKWEVFWFLAGVATVIILMEVYL